MSEENVEIVQRIFEGGAVGDFGAGHADLDPDVVAGLKTPTIPTSLPPGGPAGGVLTGTYPNPSGLAANSVGASQIAANSVGASQITDGNVGTAEVADLSLGGHELKTIYTAVSAGEATAANGDASETASCTGTDRLLGGGYAWQNNPAEVEMHSNAPASLNAWIAEGSSSSANTLFAWAVCLPA